jgi:S1-C subfamily serine protease
MKLSFCLILQLFMIHPAAIHAGVIPAQTFRNCDKAWKLVKQNWNDYPTLLSKARDYLTHCSIEMSEPSRVRLLGRMGLALMNAKQYSEAVPILQECASSSGKNGLMGDYASCWEELGEASAFLGWCEAAVVAFKVALDVPTTDNLSSDAHQLARYWLEHDHPAIKCLPSSKPPPPADLAENHLYGSAFFISADGLLLTNDHVVAGCKNLSVATGTRAQIVSRDPRNDLALLKVSNKASHFVRFRSGEPARVGEPVIAFGFPFPGTLSSGGIATNGIVSSLSGVHDDPRTLQFSAAIQPGNSGGPLFDGSGNVIGVVEAKLDALHIASVTGAIPENVGFAIQWAQIEAFFESEGFKASRDKSQTNLSSSDIVSLAQMATVSVDCTL